MQDTQWTRRMLEHPVTLALAVGTIELLLLMTVCLLGWAAYWYWQKRKKRTTLHLGYIRFLLLVAMIAGAIAGFTISACYRADAWDWIGRGWLPGAAMAFLLAGGISLLTKQMIRKPEDIPWWFDPRIGDDQ